MEILATIIGILIGVVCLDWFHRAKAQSDLAVEREKLQTLMVKLSEINNGLVVKVTALEDRLAAHEMRSTKLKVG
jgi:hypothetical protein